MSLKLALENTRNHALVVVITPLAIASRFNIDFDLMWDPEYQDVCGILVKDINPILQEIGQEKKWSEMKICKVCSLLIDGYCFGGKLEVFNSRQVVYCLHYLHCFGKLLRKLVDTNLSENLLLFLSNGQNDQFNQLVLQLLSGPVPFDLPKVFVIDQ
ncbi:9988_t:CDS:1, partial [Paraglomus brasilianum]